MKEVGLDYDKILVQIKLIFQYIKLKSSAYTTFLRTKFNLVVGEEKMKLPNFG